jgi:hypothetical protein
MFIIYDGKTSFAYAAELLARLLHLNNRLNYSKNYSICKFARAGGMIKKTA